MAQGTGVSLTLRGRTRHLNKPQSKNGCFTCRARRKKCDEEKPICKRCLREGRTCEGYKSNESGVLTTPAVCRGLATGIQVDGVRDRFSQLGREILMQQARSDSFIISAAIWTTLIPQLSASSACVNAAVACLGSAYESLVLRCGSSADRLNIYYRKAISSLRDEIGSHGDDKTPLFLTCIVLAAVEVLQRRLVNAMIHLRGAFRVLTLYLNEIADWEAFYRIAQALDIQTATFALGQPPDLPARYTVPSSTSPGLTNYLSSPTNLQTEVLSLLHACYHYSHEASAYKYCLPSEIPQAVILNQGRFIALLSQWIIKLDSRKAIFQPDTSAESVQPNPSHVVLRLQCISTLIYLASILNSFEKNYDPYTFYFQQIVTEAAYLLPHLSNDHADTPAKRFRILSPLAQPLYFTAMKCRNRNLRQEAISLLSLTGKEGPWDSKIQARVATRVVEIEHALGVDDDNVPERARIHGSGILSEGINSNAKQASIEVQFSRCVDVDRMLACANWEDQNNWEIWAETLMVGE